MTTKDFLEKIRGYPWYSMNAADLLYSDIMGIDNNTIRVSSNNIVSQIKPSYYFYNEGFESSILDKIRNEPNSIFVLSNRVGSSDYRTKAEYFHPKHLFRFEHGRILHSKIPLPLDYKTTSSQFKNYETTELNNRNIIQAACKDSSIVSFLHYRIKKDKSDHLNVQLIREKKIYVFGEGFYIFFAPELLFETDFALNFGSPSLTISMSSLNKYLLIAEASKRTGYLKDTESKINAVFNLETFSFEKFDVIQESYSLK